MRFLTTVIGTLLLISCQKESYEAYFGGEIVNPKINYVLFCKGPQVIDTLYLDKQNRFFKKFDSLAPGLYNFKHFPEYQYVYFDKNDSLMVRLNAFDFDNSVVFCGKGDEKNNFLMEMFLKNEADKADFFTHFESGFDNFNASINQQFAQKKKFYEQQKKKINWNSDFDAIAQASYRYPYYFKKELYPLFIKVRTGKNILSQLPSNYYDYRSEINFNDDRISDYSPFIRYINTMLNNLVLQRNVNNFNEFSLENNLAKLQIADTLFKNTMVKNSVLRNIATVYLMEDQNMYDNQKFVSEFSKISKDTKLKKELNHLVATVHALQKGKTIPQAQFITSTADTLSVIQLIKSKTIFFFWTSKFVSHAQIVHKKVAELKKKYPNITFVSVNLDDSENKWKQILLDNQFKYTTEVKALNSETLKNDWVLTKIHRTIIVNPNGTIANGFTNIFDVNFSNTIQ